MEPKPKRKKPGPPKTKGKDKIRAIRMPDDEWEALRELAASQRLTIAAWIRATARKAVQRWKRSQD